MKSKAITLALVLCGLALVSIATAPLQTRAWVPVRSSEPAMNLLEVQSVMGQGVTFALLGGFRTLAADVFWLKMNSTWEERNLPATQSLIRVATTIDPRPLYFWINGARIVGYDMPHWRVENAGGANRVPATVQRRFDLEQAEVALALLERALRYHPDHPLLLIEMAGIKQRRVGDLTAAAELFRRAAERPDAPHYAGRIHGELLRRLGREREAYQWLSRLYQTLPLDDPTAAPEVVLGRIRDLEGALGLPADERVVERQPATDPKAGARAES